MSTCLPDVKVVEVNLCLDKLVDSTREESSVMVHIGTNDMSKLEVWSSLKQSVSSMKLHCEQTKANTFTPKAAQL